jgi:hypothetical protein
MEIDCIDFAGWEQCVKLIHQDLTLIVTTRVGPRIISCTLNDHGNLFYVNPDEAGIRGGEKWQSYGGHRLWCAPEDIGFTYAPDNQPVQVAQEDKTVRFTAPTEKSGVQKAIAIQPLESRNGFLIEHIIRNAGNQPLQLAPWALTVMRAGGTAIIPHNLDRKRQLLPTHSISMWSYTDPGDPRIRWGKRYILVHQNETATTPLKIGLQNPYGWAGYVVNGQIFLKRFAWDESARYPDFNCNCEIYTNPDILEVETLAPLQELAPGASTTHREEWEVFEDIPTPRCDEDIDLNVLPLI